MRSTAGEAKRENAEPNHPRVFHDRRYSQPGARARNCGFGRSDVRLGALLIVDTGHDGDWRYEAIAPARNGFDKPWLRRRITQNIGHLADRRVQRIIEIDNGVTPQPRAQFLPGHNLSGPLQKRKKETKREILNLDSPVLFPELTNRDVNFKYIEADRSHCAT